MQNSLYHAYKVSNSTTPKIQFEPLSTRLLMSVCCLLANQPCGTKTSHSALPATQPLSHRASTPILKHELSTEFSSNQELDPVQTFELSSQAREQNACHSTGQLLSSCIPRDEYYREMRTISNRDAQHRHWSTRSLYPHSK